MDFDIVTIKKKLYVLFILSQIKTRIILVCLKTKKHYKHDLNRTRSEFLTLNIESQYLKNTFIYIEEIVKKRDNTKKMIANLYYMTSIKKFETLKLPKNKYQMWPLQVHKKCDFFFTYYRVLFSLSLKAKKTKIIDSNFMDSSCPFSFSEKLKRHYKIGTNCKVTTTNKNTYKVASKKYLNVEGSFGNSKYFSKDGRFLIIKGYQKIYHLFSTVDEFKLIKILCCYFESSDLIFENRNIYFFDFNCKRVFYFRMLSSWLSGKKKTTDINHYRKKKNKVTYLGKRTNPNFEKVVKSKNSKLQKAKILFNKNKPTKKEKKMKH